MVSTQNRVRGQYRQQDPVSIDRADLRHCSPKMPSRSISCTLLQAWVLGRLYCATGRNSGVVRNIRWRELCCCVGSVMRVKALTLKRPSGVRAGAPSRFTMRRHRSSRSSLGEIHRYFPEWADRPTRDGVLWESDRNSYSAGGYAEEFGYASQAGLPPPARALHGDAERSAQWCSQTGALHPGYPECSKPLDRDKVRPRGAPVSGAQSSGPERVPRPADFRVIRVGHGHSVSTHVGLVREFILLWKVLGIRHLPKPHRF
jgi:hypothetical protein